MATSGTVGQTVINVQQLIDHGARRCGKLAEELTSEQQVSARESLFFLLSNLINLGIQYWAIDKKVFGLNANPYLYDLPLGAHDVLNALYRKMNRPTANSSGGYINTGGGVTVNAFDSDIDTYCQQTIANATRGRKDGQKNPIYAVSRCIVPEGANI